MEPLEDPVMGRLVWNDEFNEWQGELVTSSGVAVELSVEAADQPASITEAARNTFAWLAENEAALRGELAERMLENALSWRQEGEPAITRGSFAERVELTHASLGADGEMHLSYSDDEMFGGHLIAAPVGADRVMGNPHLVG
jgi:hypothetical protein